jgi:ABC-type branched-subunit amino acid transport system substrate-binding protein
MTRPSFSDRPFVALIGIPVLSLLLAACGSEGAGDEVAAIATATSTASALRIGLEAPLSGSQSELGEGMLQGAELAAEELNAAGGVLGRQVEIVPIDDEADPAVAQSAAQAAVDQGLDGVVGPYNSGAGAQSLPIYVDAGLVPMRLTTSDSTAGFGFTLQPMTSQIAPVAVTAITDWAQATSVALVVDSTTDYTVAAAEAIESLLPESGVSVTSVQEITPGADSYTDAINAALVTNPDLLYVVAYYPEAATVAKDLTAAGSGVECMVDYGGFDNGYITSAGVDAAQTCSVVGVPSPSDFPNSAALVESFQVAFGSLPGSWSPYTYDSVMLLGEVFERVGTTEVDAVQAALAGTEGWVGWTGTVAFEQPSGNRVPAPVTVNTVTPEGAFSVDQTWVSAVGFTY